MPKFKQKFNLLIAALFVLTFFINFSPAEAVKSTGAVVKPQLKIVSQPAKEYKVGERVSFKVYAPNFSGKVEYRVILWDGNKKAQRELWPKMPGYYYKNWTPSGKQVFTIGWPINEPGPYSITVLVRRAGTKVSYDSYVKTISFVVKPNAVILDKEKATYGSQDPAKPDNVNSDVRITVKSVSYNNANVTGNLYILADNSSLKNINVKGNIIINPGDNGTASLENVTASQIQVLSGGQNSIQLKNVKAQTLVLDNKSVVSISAGEGTAINNTSINWDAELKADGGSFGYAEITNKNIDKKYVDLVGKFDKVIKVESSASIKTTDGDNPASLIIEPEEGDDAVGIELDGLFDTVEIQQPAAIELVEGAKVNNLICNYLGYVYFNDNAVINKVNAYGILYVEGKANINEQNGNIIYKVENSELPSGDNLIEAGSIETSFGYKSIQNTEFPVMFIKLKDDSGNYIIPSSGFMYAYDGSDIIKTKYQGGDYTILVNPDGTLALPEGNFDVYIPVGEKWYHVNFSTKQAGNEGEYKSDIISINGKPYTYERWEP